MRECSENKENLQEASDSFKEMAHLSAKSSGEDSSVDAATCCILSFFFHPLLSEKAIAKGFDKK